MTQIVSAIYENGVLRPETELQLVRGARVRLVIDECDSCPDRIQGVWEDFERLCDEAPVDTGGHRLTRDELHGRSCVANVDRELLDTLKRRNEEMDSGAVQGRAHSEVMAAARKALDT
ncbi:MAG TPA: antitoxin family protein [Planctomycetaceae bacterium]|nr:antitoxin family protein [Planctomycetaceae bacterium]